MPRRRGSGSGAEAEGHILDEEALAVGLGEKQQAASQGGNGAVTRVRGLNDAQASAIADAHAEGLCLDQEPPRIP